MLPPPLRSTLFPYTTLFRSQPDLDGEELHTPRLAPEPLISRARGSRKARAPPARCERLDRKSTRLNSSHGYISYAVFCLKKKINTIAYSRSAKLKRCKITER